MVYSILYAFGLISMTVMLPLAATQKACYFPNGARAPESWTPCNATAEESHCCMDTDLCLDNKYCYSQDDGTGTKPFTNRLFRGGFTDENWKSPQCPYYCIDCKFENVAILLLNPIVSLPWTVWARLIGAAAYSEGGKTIALVRDRDFGMFCCGEVDIFNGTQCNVSTHGDASPFVIFPGRAIQDRHTGNNELPPATSNTTCPSTQNTTSFPSQACATTAAGVGVGVSLGILLLSAVVWALYLRRQLKRLRASQPSSNTIADMGKPQIRMLEGNEQKIPEASGMSMAEMGSHTRILELHARNDR